MNDIKNVSEKLLALLKEKGAEKFALSVSESEKRELNTENSDFSLFRTIFDEAASVSVINGGRKGSAAGNDLSEEGLEKLVSEAILSSESSLEDDANDVAEYQEPEVFAKEDREPDMDRFYDSLEKLLSDIGSRYPRVRILQLIGDHTKTHNIYLNSSGTRFETLDGVYGVMIEMSAADGSTNTGLDGVEVVTRDLETPLIEQGGIALHMDAAEKSLVQTAIDGKFEGTVIFTPDCLGSFASMLLGNFCGSQVIIDGTSLWLDKIGGQVASDKLTVTLKAEDERIAQIGRYTGEGFRAEDVTVIDRGVLKSHVLSLYAAKKTGRPVTKNADFAVVIEPGETALSDMIASVKQGLMVGGFSGGQPTANGEFSGVAKNSFYIKDGKILGAVTETMINGNLESVFRNVEAVSKEVVCDGTSVLPYMASSGIVISCGQRAEE